MLNNVLSILSTAFNAGWTWFNQLFAAVPGLLSFFMAVFTFTCICRFFVLPILGGGFVTSSHEDRKNRATGGGYSQEQRVRRQYE